ncbi:MAG: hypothetical protein QXR48_04255 [Candidatus Woesearchaeota archaeon]
MALMYQTLFPVDSKKDLCDLAKVIAKWIAGSPHRGLKEQELQEIATDGFEFSKNNNFIETALFEGTNEKMYGVRLIEKTDAMRTTEIVGCKSAEQYFVSVIHEYETDRPGDICKRMLRPRIVHDAINGLGGGMDGTMLYTRCEPFVLQEDDLEFVAEIIKNQSENRLPIVYISRSPMEQLFVNPEDVARELAGMAHVLIEPSRKFSYRLKERTDGRNIYNGAVGIHWPNGMREYYMYPFPEEIVNVLYETVRQAALHTTITQKLSFDGIKLLQTSKKAEELRKAYESAKQESKILLELSEQEKESTIKDLTEKIKNLEERLALAEKENEILEKQAKDLASKNACLELKFVAQSRKQEGGELIKKPTTAELYAGETADIVIAALAQYLNSVPDASRRQDIVKAILDINRPTGKYEEIVAGVENAFRNNTGKFNERFANSLRALGFEIIEGPHPAVYVPGHEGRKVSISGTPGDVRSRKNEVARLKRYLL